MNQYEAGYIQGKDAAEFIKTNMGGQAEVVYYNANQTAPSLIPREVGAIAGLKTGAPVSRSSPISSTPPE